MVAVKQALVLAHLVVQVVGVNKALLVEVVQVDKALLVVQVPLRLIQVVAVAVLVL
jgi:hypothetical protein